MIRLLMMLCAAFLCTAMSAWVVSSGDERALYGHEGPLDAYYQPREVAGWPAPFLADTPNSSVIHQIGPEDDFRPGSFVASCAFWLLALIGLGRVLGWAQRRARGE